MLARTPVIPDPLLDEATRLFALLSNPTRLRLRLRLLRTLRDAGERREAGRGRGALLPAGLPGRSVGPAPRCDRVTVPTGAGRPGTEAVAASAGQ
jgi:hypothetical protein